MSKERLKRNCKSLSKKFREAANDLDKHFENVNVARVISGTVATASSVLSIGCAVASVFTMGASLPLAYVSATYSGISAAGSLATAGAHVIGDVIKDTVMKDMEGKWDVFKKDFKMLAEEVLQGSSTEWTVGKVLTGGVAVSQLVSKQAAAMAEVITLAQAGGVATTASRLTTAANLSIVSLNAAGLAVNAADLVNASVQLSRNSGSPAGKQLRRLADKLDDLYDTV